MSQFPEQQTAGGFWSTIGNTITTGAKTWVDLEIAERYSERANTTPRPRDGVIVDTALYEQGASDFSKRQSRNEMMMFASVAGVGVLALVLLTRS